MRNFIHGKNVTPIQVNTQNDIIYQRPLCPINNSEQEKTYENFFDFAFDRQDIKNIAVTAPKGAGKSSVVRTYLEGHSKIKTIDVSVGLYNKQEDSGDKGKDIIMEEQQVEMKILNQIIHQVDARKIPASRFHIDRDHKYGISIFRAILFGLLLLCVLYFCLYPFLTNFSGLLRNNRIIKDLMNFDLFIPVCLTCVLILSCFVFFFFKNYANKRLPKMAVHGCEIEPVKDENNTMFNKYLDEMLYIIINSECDAVIFEDLERLNDHSIWIKLREINYILNKRIENTRKFFKKENKCIKFIYLTSDSLFTSKDRVKFFDYIIPIVPIVDKTNSLEMMIKLKSKSKYNLEIKDSFIGSVNMYIDDMRIINNIFNETNIYKKQLDSEKEIDNGGLDDTYLFAIALYKNLIPSDFEKFRYGNGVVYTILKKLQVKIKEIGGKNIQSNIYDAPAEIYLKTGKDFNKDYEQITNEIEEIKDWSSDDKELIKYLIGRGYISLENTEYSSYFYTDQLSSEERQFILQVKHDEEINPIQKLNKIDDILNRLRGYMDSKRIMNCYIVEHIMLKMEIYKSQILATIRKYQMLDFIEIFIRFEYNRNNDALRRFVVALNYAWEDIFLIMSQDKNRSHLYEKYAELSLSYCDRECIMKMNKDNCLTNMLNNIEVINGG